MNFKNLFLIMILSFLSCKQEKKNNVITASKITDSVSDILENKLTFIGTKWIEIEKVNNSFKKSNVKKEWLSFVEIEKDSATIFLMEPAKYPLDSIQSTKNGIILHIKNSGWIYSFSWIDKTRYIGRWDYIYNTTEIDSSFSMYSINKKHISFLDYN